jgi:hypothetical protein
LEKYSIDHLKVLLEKHDLLAHLNLRDGPHDTRSQEELIKECHDIIVDSILSTDMRYHFTVLDSLIFLADTCLQLDEEMEKLNLEQGNKKRWSHNPDKPLNELTVDQKKDLLKSVLHASGIHLHP